MEMIELINDGKGLGFGIIGGRSTGVMVKTILPGGAAGRVNPHASQLHSQALISQLKEYLNSLGNTLSHRPSFPFS